MTFGTRAGGSGPTGALEGLLMIGAALAPCEAAEPAAAGSFSSPDAFRRVKQSRKALVALLASLHADGELAEAFVWDTCQRVELYGWLADRRPPDRSAREEAAARVRERLFGPPPEPPGLAVRVLEGAAAWRHLLRTAAGLESRVPGDKDVLAQLETARRIAESAGAAGARSAALVAGAGRLVERLRAETGWGRVSEGYVAAALAGIPPLRGRPAADGRHVVVGGSTTSRSVLEALRERFGTPAGRLTLVHRGHHGRMRLLREALAGGRRLRVPAYGDPAVLGAIADADFVYFGLDQSEPVVALDRLAGLRDHAARPLVVVDFNTFGSLGAPGEAAPRGVEVWRAADLEEAAAVHAAAVRGRPEFRAALIAAGEWLDARAGEADEAAGAPSGAPVLAEAAPC